MFFARKSATMPSAADALPGRAEALPTARLHDIFKRPLKGPFPVNAETVLFGLGCFWGAERKFWGVARRRPDDGCRLCRRTYAEPDL